MQAIKITLLLAGKAAVESLISNSSGSIHIVYEIYYSYFKIISYRDSKSQDLCLFLTQAVSTNGIVH